MENEKFQKLKNAIENELKLDDNNIMNKSIQLSNFYMSILQIYNKELKELKIKLLGKDKCYGERYHHYKFKFDYQLDSKSEIDNYVRADEIFYNKALEYSQQEIQVDFLEQSLTHINNIGFKIKNYIDLQKLKQGLF